VAPNANSRRSRGVENGRFDRYVPLSRGNHRHRGEDATVYEAALRMKEQGKGALLVVDGSRLIGIFTERDALFRVIAAGRDPATTKLADVMTRSRKRSSRTSRS